MHNHAFATERKKPRPLKSAFAQKIGGDDW